MMTWGKAKPRQWPKEEGYQRFGTPDAESPEKRNSEVNLTTRQQKIITPRSNISLGGAQGGSPDERPIIGRFGRPLPLPPSIVKEREGHLDQVASEAPPRPMAPGGDDGIRAEALAGGRYNHIDQDNPFANIEEDQAPMAPGILRQDQYMRIGATTEMLSLQQHDQNLLETPGAQHLIIICPLATRYPHQYLLVRDVGQHL